MNIKKPVQIEINKEQPEWEVVQTLVKLGYKKHAGMMIYKQYT